MSGWLWFWLGYLVGVLWQGVISLWLASREPKKRESDERFPRVLP